VPPTHQGCFVLDGRSGGRVTTALLHGDRTTSTSGCTGTDGNNVPSCLLDATPSLGEESRLLGLLFRLGLFVVIHGTPHFLFVLN